MESEIFTQSQDYRQDSQTAKRHHAEEGRLDYSYEAFIRKLNAYTVPRYLRRL